jgi:hypothetical protein
MSLDPQPALRVDPPDSVPRAAEAPRRHPVLIACYALVALATGLVLGVAPWVDNWSFNSLQTMNPTLEYMWDDPVFRSSLSVLGLLNIVIALRELLGLLRSAPRQG